MFKQQQSSLQRQLQQHYIQLQTRLMQCKDSSMSILVAINSTNKKKESMKSWVLLDSDSTTDIFGESKSLNNIKTVTMTLNLMTNGGLLTTNQQGNFKNYRNV